MGWTLGRELPPEHREDQFPVSVGGPLVVDVAVGERIAVLGAGIHLVTVVDHILTTPGLSEAELVAMLGETAAKLLAIKPASTM